MGDQVVGQRSIDHTGGVKFFTGDGRADDGEDARPDDRADAQGGERDGAKRFLERALGPLRLVDQLVDGLCGKDLAGQVLVPRRRGL